MIVAADGTDYLNRFRVLTGSGYLAADLGWLVARASDDPPIDDVQVVDATEHGRSSGSGVLVLETCSPA